MTAHHTLAGPPATAPWPMQALKAVAVLHVVALLFQAVTAGMLLSSPGGRALHLNSGIALGVIGLAHLVAAILVWRPGGGSARFVGPAAALLLLTAVAAVLGLAHVTVPHVPLGVGMFGGGVVQLLRVLAADGRGDGQAGRRSERGQT
ncbi:hypothetical protein OIE67_46925 [Nonomuraea fuscirosea]|jgi:hypothetical protein|uniref:hypothetical protein n=1 Tax=Nonomuraea fuscirosea TaxID=1291556 RepID=UPI002DD7A296|nr:hypothetical protein [Nonomuraea fuscirosea]WSA51504.1 hypothetical protein OIE67_46925 [Nonomuraea fuscirosea]